MPPKAKQATAQPAQAAAAIPKKRGRPLKVVSEAATAGSSSAAAPAAAEPAPAKTGRGRKKKVVAAPTNDEEEVDIAEIMRNSEQFRGPRKATRKSQEGVTQNDFNGSQKFRAWLETLMPGLKENSVSTYSSQYKSKLENWKLEKAPEKTMYEFFTQDLDWILEKLRNMDNAINTKKGVAAFLLWTIDNFPPFKEDERFINSDDVVAVRVYFSTMKQESVMESKLRGKMLYYPLTSAVLKRIELRLQGMERVYAKVMIDCPVRNDLILKYTDIEYPKTETTAEKGKEVNWLYIPNDETKPCVVVLRTFKTANQAERYITRIPLSQDTSRELQYQFKSKFQKIGDFVFHSNKNAMSALSKSCVTSLGYDWLDGGSNFWRRVAASNMAYEVENGRKTKEDQNRLALMMQHSSNAAENSYIHQIDDGTMNNFAKRQKMMCQQIQQCVADHADVFKEILNVDGDADDEDDEDEQPAPKRTRK